MGELKNAFKPEFLNRIDDIIVFTKLSHEDIKQIAKNLLSNLAKRLNALEISIEFDESVSDALATIGFDETYGARPLRRKIQNEIEDNLSEKILEATIKKGDKVICSYKDNEFIFTK